MHALTSTRMKKIASSKLNKKDVEQKTCFHQLLSNNKRIRISTGLIQNLYRTYMVNVDEKAANLFKKQFMRKNY